MFHGNRNMITYSSKYENLHFSESQNVKYNIKISHALGGSVETSVSEGPWFDPDVNRIFYYILYGRSRDNLIFSSEQRLINMSRLTCRLTILRLQ